MNSIEVQPSALISGDGHTSQPATFGNRDAFEIIETLKWPYASRCNPHLQALEQYAAENVERMIAASSLPYHKLRTLALELPLLAALAYPDIGLDDLLIGHDLLQWLFVFDDQCDDGPLGRDQTHLRQTTGRLLSMLSNRQNAMPLAETPTEKLLCDLWLRIVGRMPSHLQTRFIGNLSDYLQSYEWEASNRLALRFPEPERYLIERQRTGAVHCCFDLVAFSARVDIESIEEQVIELRQLQFLACQVICLVNDIISAEKEHQSSDFSNLVLIYMDHYSIGINEASRRAAELSQWSIGQFEEIAGALTLRGLGYSSDLHIYLDGLRMWMIANAEWSLSCSRYRDR